MKPSPRLFLAALLAGGVVLALGMQAQAGDSPQDLIPSGLVDPPLIVTNQTDAAVTLQWQSAVPGAMLSPARSATIAAGAAAQRIDRGLFWIVSRDGGQEVLVDNDIYVSRVDGEGFATQSVLRTDGIASLDEARQTALSVTIAADGSIALEAVPNR